MKIPNIRLLLHSIRNTPLHPQWFAYHYEKLRYIKTGNLAKGTVLDIGCGRQPLRHYLTPSTTYVSLDFPKTGKCLYNAKPNVFGDAINLPFQDSSFDTVVMLELLEHLPDPLSAIQETCRVLKKGGIIILSTPFLYPIHDSPHDYQRWTIHGLENMINTAGLVVQDQQTMGTPIESGILLFNLSLAWNTLNAPKIGRLPLFLLSLFSIPMLNIFGFFISLLFKVRKENPFAISYLLVAEESE